MWLAGWTRNGPKGKFVSASLKYEENSLVYPKGDPVPDSPTKGDSEIEVDVRPEDNDII
jgi:hypothetical protein